MRNTIRNIGTVFRITANINTGDVAYSRTYKGAQAIADLITRNGYVPCIKPIKRMDVPIDELEIVNEL